MSMKRGTYFLFLFFLVGALQVNALCVPHAVQGTVLYDGIAADGASLVLIDKNTNASITDIVGPLGNAGVSGWHALDLGNLDPCPTNGDVIDIIASKNGYNGRALFTYDSSVGYTIPETIHIESINSKVTRSFSNNTPTQCQDLIVSLQVDLNGFDSFYEIDEIVPGGWAITDPGTGDTSEPGHIKWAVFENVQNTTHHYTVAVPCNATGTYSFDGIYIFESDLEEQTILGETDVIVQEVMTSFNLELYQGWNLFSIPLKLNNLTLPTPLKSIQGNYSNIFTYQGAWKELTDGDNLNEKTGFWIKMTQDDTLELQGTEIINKSINLEPGWNLVGYPYLIQKNVTDINTTVLIYNGSWYSYTPNKTDNSLKTLKPGLGYWVKDI